nr:hypothetical protein [Ferrimonas sp. YFM]
MNQFSKEEILNWIELMEVLKEARRKNALPQTFKSKSLGMIFQQSSTRTRVSFETAATLLGGHALFLSPRDIHLNTKETLEDTSRVVARMCDVVMIRDDLYADIERYAEASTIPVINAMSCDVHGDDCGNHPTQCLADLLTIKEHLPEGKKLEDAVVVVIGDASTPTASLAYATSKLGMTMKVISPMGYNLPQQVIDIANANNELSGGRLIITDDVNEVVGADFIQAEEWCWGRSPEEVSKRDVIFGENYVTTMELMEKAGPETKFMHVLPANAGGTQWEEHKEVTREVMESGRSVVFDEAENRLSAMMALLTYYSHPHHIEPKQEDIEFFQARTDKLLNSIFPK